MLPDAAPAEADLQRTRDVILERAQKDFEEGLQQVQAHIRQGHSRPVAATLSALVAGATRALRLRSEFRRDAVFVMDLADEVADGADPDDVATRNLDRVLKVSHLQLVVRVNDAAFAPVKEMARRALAARLPDLARMVRVADARDYEDVVRKAFPQAKEAHHVIDEQRAFVEDIIAYLEAHPDLLRFPGGMVPRLAATARSFVDWQTREVRATVDAIYDGGS